MNDIPENLVRQPDGSFVDPKTLHPRRRLAHDFVEEWFPSAEALNAQLVQLKRLVLSEMRAHRDMMLADYEVKIDGKEGGFSLQNIQGTSKIELSVNKQTRFGEELEAAKKLVDEFLDKELEGSSAPIRAIVENVFKVNSKGRLDTAGIIGLTDKRKYDFHDPLWERAMQAIDDAIIKDSATTYLRFYRRDPELNIEVMVPLNLAKV